VLPDVHQTVGKSAVVIEVAATAAVECWAVGVVVTGSTEWSISRPSECRGR